MEELIEKALSKVKDERLLIDKLIKAEEDEDYITREALKEVYRAIFVDTNCLVDKMLTNYSEEELFTNIMSGHDELDDDTFDRTTLCFLLSNRYRDLLKESVFDEENNKYLYAMYLWFIKNTSISDEEKESLHKFVNLRATQSSFLRQYFSGDTRNIEELCVPEKSFGIMSDLLAQRAYYDLLQNVIKDSNCTEMFEGDKEYAVAFEGRKKLIELEFAAICAEMINRNVCFPLVEEPISDFTRDLLQKSSTLANKFLALRKRKN